MTKETVIVDASGMEMVKSGKAAAKRIVSSTGIELREGAGLPGMAEDEEEDEVAMEDGC